MATVQSWLYYDCRREVGSPSYIPKRTLKISWALLSLTRRPIHNFSFTVPSFCKLLQENPWIVWLKRCILMIGLHFLSNLGWYLVFRDISFLYTIYTLGSILIMINYQENWLSEDDIGWAYIDELAITSSRKEHYVTILGLISSQYASLTSNFSSSFSYFPCILMGLIYLTLSMFAWKKNLVTSNLKTNENKGLNSCLEGQKSYKIRKINVWSLDILD